MSVIKHDCRLKLVRLEVDPHEIPDLLAAHRREWEAPDRLEAKARTLCQYDFPPGDSARFVESVIKWGRGNRFVGRFVQRNTPANIASTLRQSALVADEGRVSRAVAVVQQLEYLGQSFASKIVRFLRPSLAVILDDVIRSALGYRKSEAGYDEFLADCQSILEVAQEIMPGLRICDVEAAIFAKIQGY